MARLLARRLLLSIPLLFVVTILTFVMTALTPGNPAITILGTSATPQEVETLNRNLGLDHPIYQQYWDWLVKALQGNLGQSIFTGEPVRTILAQGLPVTLTLIIGSLMVAFVLGVPIGVVSASRKGSGGQVVDAVSLVGFAMPSFFLGLLLAYVFSTKFPILPASGWVGPSTSVTRWLKSIVLPIATLALPGAAIIARQTRQGMREVLARDFIRSLRARGLSRASILYKHALRNSLGNVVTLLGLYVVGLLLGTTLVETVFAMQGIGSIAVNAVNQHDLPILEGAALYFTVLVILAFVIVDLARAWLNPKLRTQ